MAEGLTGGHGGPGRRWACLGVALRSPGPTQPPHTVVCVCQRASVDQSYRNHRSRTGKARLSCPRAGQTRHLRPSLPPALGSASPERVSRAVAAGSSRARSEPAGKAAESRAQAPSPGLSAPEGWHAAAALCRTRPGWPQGQKQVARAGGTHAILARQAGPRRGAGRAPGARGRRASYHTWL